jgi:large subunit ribosomal protein L22
MEAIAKLRNIPSSPRKMRLVADLVRGKKVSEAQAILKFSKQEASLRIEKLLLSAISNWVAKNEDGEIDNAFVKAIWVDCGTMMKRIQPAPQGRAHRVRKRSNHVTMIIDSFNKA